jgi:hypothetical protein
MGVMGVISVMGVTKSLGNGRTVGWRPLLFLCTK